MTNVKVTFKNGTSVEIPGIDMEKLQHAINSEFGFLIFNGKILLNKAEITVIEVITPADKIKKYLES